jgi:hypothetical protein
LITFTDLGLFSYLGNELFQYAALLGVAERRGYEARLPPSVQHRLGTLIELDTPTYTSEELQRLRWRFAQCYPRYGYEPALEEIPDWCDVFGYFQSRHHFPQRLRELYRLRPEVTARVDEIWVKLRLSGPVTGFHVRRGDNVGSSHWLLLEEGGYYDRAKACFKGLDCTFLVVSQDPEWSAIHLAGPQTVIAGDAPAEIHLALLARCDHLILANSSFSWWAAWFQEPHGGKVVAPKQWYHAGTFAETEQDIGPDWVLV